MGIVIKLTIRSISVSYTHLWNYRDLYIAILEDLAKRLKINRFQIYTVDRLIGKIMMKLHSLDSRIPL